MVNGGAFQLPQWGSPEETPKYRPKYPLSFPPTDISALRGISRTTSFSFPLSVALARTFFLAFFVLRFFFADCY